MFDCWLIGGDSRSICLLIGQKYARDEEVAWSTHIRCVTTIIYYVAIVIMCTKYAH